LTTADDSLIFRNPAASGTDSGYILKLDQLAAGSVDLLQLSSGNASGTSTNGILLDQAGAGTLTNGINITNSAGTLTNAITIGSGSQAISTALNINST